MEDVVVVCRVRRAQNLLLAGSEHLAIDTAVVSESRVVLQAEVDARHARLLDDAAREFRDVGGDDGERRLYRFLIGTHEIREERLTLVDRARLHKFHRRRRGEDIVERRDLIAVAACDLLRIRNLPREERVVVGQRLHLRELRRRTRLLHDGIRIGEEPVRHDLYKVRLRLLDVAQLPVQDLFLERRIIVRVRVNFVVEEVEPKSRRNAFDFLAIHRAQHKFFLRYRHDMLPSRQVCRILKFIVRRYVLTLSWSNHTTL